MAEVIWTNKASGQLERSIKYILEEQGYSYAEIVLNQILAKTRELEKQPLRGRPEPRLQHMKSEYRYIVVWSYKIIYRVANEKIVISRVFHTSRDPRKLRGI